MKKPILSYRISFCSNCSSGFLERNFANRAEGSWPKQENVCKNFVCFCSISVRSKKIFWISFSSHVGYGRVECGYWNTEQFFLWEICFFSASRLKSRKKQIFQLETFILKIPYGLEDCSFIKFVQDCSSSTESFFTHSESENEKLRFFMFLSNKCFHLEKIPVLEGCVFNKPVEDNSPTSRKTLLNVLKVFCRNKETFAQTSCTFAQSPKKVRN